jgi:hypothetical protein
MKEVAVFIYHHQLTFYNYNLFITHRDQLALAAQLG